MTLKEIINESIEETQTYTNVNSKGYKYNLPSEFTVYEDKDYVQILLSKNNLYYMNIDIVSYYYKNKIEAKSNLDDYEFYTFNYNDKTGYLKVSKENDTFLVELCYNYAIIEVEVEESELRYAVSRSIAILNSIQYNDLVIGKYIEDNNIENSETIYKIPKPENTDNNKNVLEYLEEFEVGNADDLD
jgi:hypothetical protein